jgi:hypothetical protein
MWKIVGALKKNTGQKRSGNGRRKIMSADRGGANVK